jgi:hypothetical protein
MNIFGYKFKGPYEIGDEVIDRPSVYIIVNSNDRIVDVDQTGSSGVKLSDHERKSCWDENEGTRFFVAWMPTDEYEERDRKMLVNQIKETINFIPCREE